MSLDSIVSISITTSTASPSRAGFGEPGLIAFVPTSIFSDRSRVYTSLTGMISDGFLASDPAYLMAVALKAQNPSVPQWKILRKALVSVQTLRLTPTITTEGEILSVTVNGTEVNYTILAGASVATICTAMTTLLNAVTGVTCSDDTTHMTITPKNVATATLTVTGIGAGTYTAIIDGTSYAFVAAAETATQIRDALQALIIAGGYAAAEVVDNGVDALDFAFASHAGADLRETASGGTMALSAEVLANRLLPIGLLSKGLTIKDNTPDPGIATDWAAIIAETTDFYGVGLDSQSEAEINALAAVIETQRMLFVPGSIDSENKDASTTTDVCSDLAGNSYARTGVLQSEYNTQYSGLRWMGKMLPKDPGSATWAYKTLAGNTVSTLTGAEETGLDGKSANHYTDVGGIHITQKGYSASGEFIDITRGVDWFQARLQERIYRLLVVNDKITYDDAGELFRAEILAQLQEGEKNQVISPDTEDTPWVVTVEDPADISAANKALRNYPDIEFSAFLAGAVHTLEITGTLSL